MEPIKSHKDLVDYAHFLAIAQGSLAETERFLLLAARLKFITEANAANVLAAVDEVGRMLTTLRQRVSRPNT